MSSASGADGVMKVLAAASAPGYVTTWASVETYFAYDHDHDWLNNFYVEYRRCGAFSRVPNGESDFYVKVELFDASTSPETCVFSALDGRTVNRTGLLGLETRSVGFSCFLKAASTYRIRISVSATCSVAAMTEGSATIDCYADLPEDHRIDVSHFVVSHVHRCKDLTGGVMAPPSAAYQFEPRQDSFDWAGGLYFESHSYDDDAGKIKGWWAQCWDFDGGTTERLGDRAISYNPTISTEPYIPRGYYGSLNVRHYFENTPNEANCHNYCHLRNLQWQSASPGALRASDSKIVPDHGWDVIDPVQLPEYPGKWVHVFKLTNDDPSDTLRVSSLSFHAMMADSQTPSSVVFPDTVQYDFVLPPLQQWSLNIVTDDTLYGGFVYFKFSLYDTAAASIVFHAWGKHEVARIVTGVPEMPGTLSGCSLAQNYPNPFNPSTVIAYAISRDGRVRLDVYDIAGRKIATLVDRLETAGEHSVRWDGRNGEGRPVASGIYVCKLKAGGFVDCRKMLLLR